MHLQSVAEKLASLTPSDRRAALSNLTDDEAEALLYDWRGFHARPDQVMPDGDWEVWLVLAGRGWGKTRTGAEAVREVVENDPGARIGLIAETAADARDVMVDALLRVFPPDQRPKYTISKRLIEFHNGAVAFTYNATEPDQLRGPQHSFLWSDELAKWKYARETWDQAQFGLRIGLNPRQIVTTTPRPIELVKSIVAGQEGKVHVTRGRTVDNSSNLAASFLTRIQARYAGSRLGRQELDAEILGDLPGALWPQSVIDSYRLVGPDAAAETMKDRMVRVVVAVDPAVTNTENSDDHGIVVAGVDGTGTGYILDDCSMQGSPVDWARQALRMSQKWGADGIVVEVNQGGDMVAHVLRSVSPNVNILEVRASRGKHVRAAPIASLYHQGRIRHVGHFPDLEKQMTEMTTSGFHGEGSPDRVDAMVWACSELFPDMIEEIQVVPVSVPRRSGGWMGR